MSEITQYMKDQSDRALEEQKLQIKELQEKADMQAALEAIYGGELDE